MTNVTSRPTRKIHALYIYYNSSQEHQIASTQMEKLDPFRGFRSRPSLCLNFTSPPDNLQTITGIITSISNFREGSVTRCPAWQHKDIKIPSKDGYSLDISYQPTTPENLWKGEKWHWTLWLHELCKYNVQQKCMSFTLFQIQFAPFNVIIIII